jgi:predicted ATP-grasp superfamily ATP-dependent carboligase
MRGGARTANPTEQMSTPVLLVSTATQYIGTARMPEALAKAGFEVSLLTPTNSLAAKSRFVAHCDLLPDNATPLQWLSSFVAMVDSVSPRVVLPCDDNSVRLLRSLVSSPPGGMSALLHLKLAALVRQSLGDPQHYRTSMDKTLLTPAAEALGVRVPPYAVVTDLTEATAFAAGQEYPLVLKCGYGTAGDWVAIVSSHAELAQAFARFMAAPVAAFDEGGGKRLLIQAYIPGNSILQSIVAWGGTVLAGYAREKLKANPSPKGPSTLTRIFHCPEARAFAELLAAEFGMNAFFGVEFIADRRTGQAYLLEINRRITPGTYLGSLFDVDLCAALYNALHDGPPPVRKELNEGEEHFIAHFPQEWLCDSASRYLREWRVDAPWNDPDLFLAMLALRHA